MNERNFERLGERSRERQKFVDKLDLQEASLYIVRRIYNPVQELFSIMRVRPASKIFSRKRGLSELVIYPLAFRREIIPTFADFLSAALDHEGFHAKEDYFRSKFPVQKKSKEYLERLLGFFENREKRRLKYRAEKLGTYCKSEIRAYKAQILKGPARGISSEYKLSIEKSLSLYQGMSEELNSFLREETYQTSMILLIQKIADLEFMK